MFWFAVDNTKKQKPKSFMDLGEENILNQIHFSKLFLLRVLVASHAWSYSASRSSSVCIYRAIAAVTIK